MNASAAHGEAITVILIAKAGDDLRRLQARTNLSRTDLANRAITLYEFIDAQLRVGHDIIARDKETGEDRLVRLLDAPVGQAQPAASRLSQAGAAGPQRRPGRHRRQLLSPGRPSRLLPLPGLAGQEARTT